jgi:hypothetical protein
MKLLIKDNFFDNVNELRNIALSSDYKCSENIMFDPGWRGYRTEELELLENDLLNDCSQKILNSVSEFYKLDNYSITTHFHISYTRTKETLEDFENKKYHFDPVPYAGVVYLHPNPPKGTGTSILDGENNNIVSVENFYNRLVAYPGNFIHAPTNLFGDKIEEGRMTLTFFIEKNWFNLS